MIGQIIGTFRIEQKIGEGGMGAVFRGHDLMLEREVAIKALRPELARQPELVARFRSEAVTLAKLNHSHIATLYNFVRHGDDYFMVMEFVRGRSLDEALRQSGAITVERAVRLFCQALAGIAHAHALGIVHRDIKPANLMLTANDQVKVMDFGIARVLGTARQTKTGRLIGTLEYMSPEQMRGAETDARSDIYSLGILLYEMLTGRVPFLADSDYELMRAQVENDPLPPRECKADIPPAVETAILQALAKDPAKRFQSATEFRSALLAAVPAAAHQPDASQQIEPALKATRVAADPKEIDWQNFTTSAAQEMPRRDSGFDATTGTFTMKLPSILFTARQRLEAKVGPLNWKHYSGAAVAVLAFIFGLSALRGERQETAPIVPPTPAPVVVLPPPNPVQPEVTAVPASNPPSVEATPIPLPTSAPVAEEKAATRVKAAPGVKAKPAPSQAVNYNPPPAPANPTPTPMQRTTEARPTPTPQKPDKMDKALDKINKGAETAGKVGSALGRIIGFGKRKP